MSSADALPAFRPNPLLAPQLIQTVLATKRPVRGRFARHDHAMHRASIQHLLDCGVADGDPVRLTGMYARQPESRPARGLAVLIHGWEGSHESVYLYSMAARVYEAGWNVFRLNLRDHAGTHALNPRMFHSARIDEVLHAVRAAQVAAGNRFSTDTAAPASLRADQRNRGMDGCRNQSREARHACRSAFLPDVPRRDRLSVCY